MSEHEEFQRWVKGLHRSRLLRAMEFTFQADDASSNSSSHEYELLMEMIKTQPPPPTPVHPRAVSHEVASSKGKTDGRHEGVRIFRCRTQRPRLFKFFKSCDVATDISSLNLPPAIAALARSSGVRGGARRRGGNTRNGGGKLKPAAASPSSVRYEISQRKFVTSYGAALSLGSTAEQRQADDKLLTYTLLDHGVGIEGGSLSLSYSSTKDDNTNLSILRMLTVASRGNFLSKSHHINRKASQDRPSFCAPWLEPTERWFSLSMYLASRFEVALFASFKNNGVVVPRKRPWEDLHEKLSEDVIETATQNALRDTLRNHLLLSDKDRVPSGIRDGILLNLVDAPEYWRVKQLHFAGEARQTTPTLRQFITSISATPLVEIGTTTETIRSSVRRSLQSEISRQMERSLVNSLMNQPASSIVATPNSRLAPSRRARKKKQRRKAGRNNNKKQAAADTSSSEKYSKMQQKGSDGEDSDGGTPRDPLQHPDGNQRLTFPENGTPFVERNRNIVLCLSMLNDIVNGVFREVGLEASSDESDSSIPGQFHKPKADGKPKEHKKPKPIPPPTMPSQKTPPPPPTATRSQSAENSSDEKKSCNPANEHLHARFSPQEMSTENDAPSITTPTGLVDTFPTQHCFPPGFFLRTGPFESNPWSFYQGSNAEGWGRTNRFPPRERSILAEFFLEQERSDASRQERVTASSTAASLASSTDKNNEDTMSISDKFFISLDNGSEAPASDIASTVISAEEFPSLGIYQEEKSASESKDEGTVQAKESSEAMDAEPEYSGEEEVEAKEDQSLVGEFRSISPEAPATPSPRCSPILLSLEDLRDIREGTKSVGNSKEFGTDLPNGVALSVPSSLPSSPVEQSKRRLVSSLSREDLRIKSFRDDHDFVQKKRRSATQTLGGSPSYRNVAAGSAKIPAFRSMSSGAFPTVAKGESRSPFFRRYQDQQQPADVCARSENAAEYHDESQNSSGPPSYRNVAAKSVKSMSGGYPTRHSADARRATLGKQQSQGDLCARSETAVEGHEDYQNWHDSRRSHEENPDNMTIGKDGSTTITSAMSHRESEETSNLREERNTFRDMCLTLGAEVAKLKNQLAAQHAAAVYPPFDYSQGYVQPVLGAGSFDPECMPPFFQKGQALGAMSDAGIHRGEYEQSQVSEDDEQLAKVNYNDSGRRMSSGATIAGSDVSIEPANSGHALQGPVGLPAPSRDSHDAVAVSGLQTRLTQDILRFLAATELQHRKLDSTRDAAVERMTRLVNTLWPRAQVKVYGSHVTGLCLPSSDLDFIICLPAVHKNAPAVAPGVLEGRNAINETSQKLLARKLKGESWIDPRSMKLIERTVVPVIKVATKDTRARTMHLDISFDSPEHHGLEAVVMVKQIVEELPMIRPLVLILKQFLLDRGLLTAYTGGLSSYCLFLMVARYLQEQPSSWGDCGSLLMGFLDFYGNCFDPRSTGISVGRRQYFTRPNYVAAQRQVAGQHMWAGVSPGPGVMPSPSSAGGSAEFYRRNSVTEKGSIDGVRGAAGSPMLRPPRFQSPGTTGTRFMRHMPQPAVHAPVETPMDHAMPFTFDPLFVDDPLSYGNNVGRNAFRIFQVQRAFSDAHRALVASLEWDIQSAGELHDNNDYPLLKCLLQSEDVLYEL